MNHPISHSESKVLQALVEMKRATAKEVHAEIGEETGWVHPTVVTFLRRLEEKGYVSHEKVKGDRAFVYTATRKGHQAGGHLVRDLMNRVFGGSPLPLVSALLADATLTPEEIESLRRIIDEHENKEIDSE